MKRIRMQASEGLELTGMGGLVLVGALLKAVHEFSGLLQRGPGEGAGRYSFR